MSKQKSITDIGGRIYSLRKSLGLVQRDFAEVVGISPNFLSEVENGVSQASKTLLVAISLRYSTNLKWLQSGEGEMISTTERPLPTGQIRVGVGDGLSKGAIAKETRIKDTCCLPQEKRDLLEAVIEVLDSGTMHSEALRQNIRAFHHAVQVEKRQAESDAKMEQMAKRLEKVEADLKQMDQDPRPPAGSSGEEAI